MTTLRSWGTDWHQLPRRTRSNDFRLSFNKVGCVSRQSFFLKGRFYFLLSILFHVACPNMAYLYFLRCANDADWFFLAPHLHAVVETHYGLFKYIEERLIPDGMYFRDVGE